MLIGVAFSCTLTVGFLLLLLDSVIYSSSVSGVVVRELTGDIQMTKKEIMETQMIVTTPEKWDVVTRKATGDVALAQIVRLLIIDEVLRIFEAENKSFTEMIFAIQF